jgi:hypothetical protein
MIKDKHKLGNNISNRDKIRINSPEVLGGSLGLENRRRSEPGDDSPAAAAGARALASRPFG